MSLKDIFSPIKQIVCKSYGEYCQSFYNDIIFQPYNLLTILKLLLNELKVLTSDTEFLLYNSGNFLETGQTVAGLIAPRLVISIK